MALLRARDILDSMKSIKKNRHWQIVTLVLTVIGTSAWGATAFAQRNKTKPAPKKVSASRVYAQNCARCHGADGAGTGLGKSLDVPDLTDPDVQRRMSASRISRVISNGDDSMPAFKSKLKPDEIKALVSYVRVFRRK